MRLQGSFPAFCFAAALLAFGCTPNIGDSCKLHTDCDATGGRLCETNLPGGYCTIFNCEQYSCPSEAACVAFGPAPSTKAECAVTQQQRLERTFCMARCSSDSSCRSGYACVDLTGGDNIWGAAVVDTDRGTKVCTLKVSAGAKSSTLGALMSASDEVCSPPLDASFPPVPPVPGLEAGAADASSAEAGSDAAVLDAARVTTDAQGSP